MLTCLQVLTYMHSHTRSGLIISSLNWHTSLPTVQFFFYSAIEVCNVITMADNEHILCIAVTPLSVDDTSLCWNLDLCINRMT